MPSTFSTLPKLSAFSTQDKGGKNYICEYRNERQQILGNAGYAGQFSQLLVNLCENIRECQQIFGVRSFLENTHVRGAGFMITSVGYLLQDKAGVLNTPTMYE